MSQSLKLKCCKIVAESVHLIRHIQYSWDGDLGSEMHLMTTTTWIEESARCKYKLY